MFNYIEAFLEQNPDARLSVALVNSMGGGKKYIVDLVDFKKREVMARGSDYNLEDAMNQLDHFINVDNLTL